MKQVCADSNDILLNPGMGFTHDEYSNQPETYGSRLAYTDKYCGGPSFEPDFGDPVYLEKLDSFLAAAAARYDGDPHVDFIDIGTLGMWGEGHTWQGSHSRYPYDVLFKHIELHTRHFKKTRAGVAPLYEDTFPALNLKDNKGGIAAVFVDESMNLRRVLPACLGGSSPVRYEQETVVRPAAPLGRASFGPLAAFDLRSDDLDRCARRTGTLLPGDHELYFSAGSRIGTPRLALPMAGHDGQRRYRVGRVRA